jgi:hypothetical protein
MLINIDQYLLSTLSKILEKAVHTQIHVFLKTNKLLTAQANLVLAKSYLYTAVAFAKFTDIK